MRQSSFIENSSRRMSNIISGKINTSTKPNGEPVFSRETPFPSSFTSPAWSVARGPKVRPHIQKRPIKIWVSELNFEQFSANFQIRAENAELFEDSSFLYFLLRRHWGTWNVTYLKITNIKKFCLIWSMNFEKYSSLWVSIYFLLAEF